MKKILLIQRRHLEQWQHYCHTAAPEITIHDHTILDSRHANASTTFTNTSTPKHLASRPNTHSNTYTLTSTPAKFQQIENRRSPLWWLFLIPKTNPNPGKPTQLHSKITNTHMRLCHTGTERVFVLCLPIASSSQRFVATSMAIGMAKAMSAADSLCATIVLRIKSIVTCFSLHKYILYATTVAYSTIYLPLPWGCFRRVFQ